MFIYRIKAMTYTKVSDDQHIIVVQAENYSEAENKAKAALPPRDNPDHYWRFSVVGAITETNSLAGDQTPAESEN